MELALQSYLYICF